MEELPELVLPGDRPLVTTRQLAESFARAPERSLAAIRAGGGVTALVARQLVKQSGRALVFVTATLERARQLEADLRFAVGDRRRVMLFEGDESDPYAEVIPDRRAAHQRLAGLFRLGLARAGADAVPLCVVPAPALLRKVVPAGAVLTASRALALYDEIDRDELAARLVEVGYVRAPLVEDPGTLSLRGSLVDVWPPQRDAPVRVELDGDLVASLKSFDPLDQKSREPLERVWLPPARESLAVGGDDEDRVRQALRELCDHFDWPTAKTRALIEDVLSGRAFFGAQAFVPAFTELAPLHLQLPDAALVIEEPSAVRDALDQAAAKNALGELAKAAEPHFPASSFFVTPAELDAWLATRVTLALCESPVSGGDRAIDRIGAVDDDTPSLTAYDQGVLGRAVALARKEGGQGSGLDPVIARVKAWQRAGLKVVFTARTTTQADRLAQMLSARGLIVELSVGELDKDALLSSSGRAEPVWVVVGGLARGTVLPGEALALCTEEEVFGSRAHKRQRARADSGRRAKRDLADLRALEVGDHVVHVDHGIGRYEGLVHREVAGNTLDMLVVAYAGNDRLYLPVYRLNQIHRLHGSDAAPTLDRLGGQSFARVKARTKKKVRDIADKLLALYAERRNAIGVATPPPDDDYRAFEASFPYEETDDQARAIADVGADLESPRPMDRLVCGDVGFGKTEVALRAAFRVASSGRQVAVLCPTTVLCQQHKMTFESRFAAYPLHIAALSRFSARGEAQATLAGLKKGSVDIVIGTHRLLSKDVHWKNLGLLVVDEEQRFGVVAKERIKELRAHIDVLTLSATPIPRTMQMAISGLRDMSLMITPPADRRSVRTVVARRDRAVIASAIQRELERGGQVFLVYNRIGGLGERAALVNELVPQARVAVAHGRMSETGLEDTMLAFVSGAVDVLVTTAIIENGLDIPRANTIIVDGAELLGMAQLYQLRGRVGRSKERGYCYLLVPEAGISGEAKTRVEALQRLSELGAGMQLAALDLDLRGAGDFLGAEQSGVIAAVGFEMFCSMLDEAAAELRGEARAPDVDPELSFDIEALLPEGYVPDVGVRLSLYKRLAGAMTGDEVGLLGEEMEDRFGAALPPAHGPQGRAAPPARARLRSERALGEPPPRRRLAPRSRAPGAARLGRGGQGQDLPPHPRHAPHPPRPRRRAARERPRSHGQAPRRAPPPSGHPLSFWGRERPRSRRGCLAAFPCWTAPAPS
jgi:transcription-repair coupling factor (superfamily II helicase)